MSENNTPISEHSKEIDVISASDIARDWMRQNTGSLNLHDFRLESVTENGIATRYLVVSSIVPDIGQKREYYLIKVDVKTGEIILPIGKGRKNEEGEYEFEDFKVKDSEWKE